MVLLDVHAHYGMNDYDAIPSDSIVHVVLTGMNSKTNAFAIKESKNSSLLYATAGFHPLEVTGNESLVEAAKVIEEIKSYNSKDIIAIAEIGLDYFHCKDVKVQSLQQTVFRQFLELAEELELPVLIHARNAVKDVLAIVGRMKEERTFTQVAVMHCMEASEKNILLAKELGCYFTIPASVVRNDQFQKIVSLIPVSKLFTETDGPFQGPVKGEPAKPEDVTYAIEYIAKEKGMEKKEVENIIFANFQKVF